MAIIVMEILYLERGWTSSHQAGQRVQFLSFSHVIEGFE